MLLRGKLPGGLPVPPYLWYVLAGRLHGVLEAVIWHL